MDKLELTITDIKRDQYIEKKYEMIQEAPQPVTREEMKESLDALAAKAISIENKVNQIKKTLAAAFSSLDERVKAIEEQTFPSEE